MSVSQQLVQHVAHLAHLNPTPAQLERYQQQLAVILDHFAELKQLDLDEAPETTRVIEEENVWREDVVEPSFTQEQALKNAPRTANGFFVVPYVLTGKDAPDA